MSYRVHPTSKRRERERASEAAIWPGAGVSYHLSPSGSSPLYFSTLLHSSPMPVPLVHHPPRVYYINEHAHFLFFPLIPPRLHHPPASQPNQENQNNKKTRKNDGLLLTSLPTHTSNNDDDTQGTHRTALPRSSRGIFGTGSIGG